MSRLETLLLLVWLGFLLLFAVFNWTLVSATEPVGFLFMTFEIAWGLWLIVLAAIVPGVIRGIAWLESRIVVRRSEHEITQLKARAFDERSGELESFAMSVQERVERTVRDVMGNMPPKN
jgi:uncharacterized integral membrane protein